MCTFNTNKIYLTWRKSSINLRHIVGVLEKLGNEYSFEYLPNGVDKAKADGFENYPAFTDLNVKYTQNVLEIFQRRLLNPQRRDYEDFLTYWCANEYKDNIFAILGLTGAKLLTDGFEFIAPHDEIPAKFNTDISGLFYASQEVVQSIREMETKEVESKLKLVQEPDNIVDPLAVKVLFDGQKLGYIKSIHCHNVSRAISNKQNVSLRIQNIVKNGTIKEILLRIEIN